MSDAIAEILHTLYEGFGDLPESDDFMLARSAPEAFRSAADYWAAVEAARVAEGSPSYDGMLNEAMYAALVEADPNLRTDALLRVAAVALAYAGSVQRQTDAFNAEEKPKAKARVKGDE